MRLRAPVSFGHGFIIHMRGSACKSELCRNKFWEHGRWATWPLLMRHMEKIVYPSTASRTISSKRKRVDGSIFLGRKTAAVSEMPQKEASSSLSLTHLHFDSSLILTDSRRVLSLREAYPADRRRPLLFLLPMSHGTPFMLCVALACFASGGLAASSPSPHMSTAL